MQAANEGREKEQIMKHTDSLLLLQREGLKCLSHLILAAEILVIH